MDLAKKFIQSSSAHLATRVGKAAGRLGCGSVKASFPAFRQPPRLSPKTCDGLCVRSLSERPSMVACPPDLAAHCVALPEPRSIAYRPRAGLERESLERQMQARALGRLVHGSSSRRAAWDPVGKCSPCSNGNCRHMPPSATLAFLYNQAHLGLDSPTAPSPHRHSLLIVAAFYPAALRLSPIQSILRRAIAAYLHHVSAYCYRQRPSLPDRR